MTVGSVSRTVGPAREQARPGTGAGAPAAGGASEALTAPPGNQPEQPFTPVPSADALPGEEAEATELARQRMEHLAALDHLIEVKTREETLTKREQDIADRKTRGWVKRASLRLSLWMGIVAAIHTSAEWIWQFFHPLSHFELVTSDATFILSGFCACVSVYLAGRFGRGKVARASGPPPGNDPPPHLPDGT